MNILWDNDLKFKKIDLECQSIVLLYIYFLREILKNKKIKNLRYSQKRLNKIIIRIKEVIKKYYTFFFFYYYIIYYSVF